MDALNKISNQISKKRACIESLLQDIAMHTNEGRYNLAAERGRDLQNSFYYIQQLENQKRLYLTAIKFANKGLNVEVVARSVQV